jgi:hypothetical protein
MKAIIVRLDTPTPKLKLKAAAVLLYGGVYFILLFSWSLFNSASGEKARGLLGIAIETGIVALVWGVLMVFVVPNLRPRATYKLQVDEDSITGVTEWSGWMRGWATRSAIRVGKVRTIFDISGRIGNPGGIGVSEKSRLGARLLGCVYLPKSMPEYEHLKQVAESWRAVESVD